MLVTRLLDGVWMAIGIGLVAILMPLPRDLLLAGDIFGIAVLVLAGGFLILVLANPSPRWARQVSGTPPRSRAVGACRGSADRAGARWRQGPFRLRFLPSRFSPSGSSWRPTTCDFPCRPGAAVYLIVHLGTALPNAPANVGSYQFFTVLGLSLFGIEKTQATGFSVVVFILLTLPLWALGLAALSRTGMTLATIRADIRAAMQLRDRVL